MSMPNTPIRTRIDDGDGVLEYRAEADQQSRGATDGLYWPADQGDGVSPAGDFVDQKELNDAAKRATAISATTSAS